MNKELENELINIVIEEVAKELISESLKISRDEVNEVLLKECVAQNSNVANVCALYLVKNKAKQYANNVDPDEDENDEP